MTIDRAALLAAVERLTAAMERDFEMLNAADGTLGDGDLGVTMTRGTRAISEQVGDMPEDMGKALMTCAQAFTKTSGSSYGTLLATGMMTIAKEVKGQSEVPVSAVSTLVAAARDKMQERGKAELGGKTVLDSLNAVAMATEGLDDPAAVADAAAQAVSEALEQFRDKKATIGRARIFGDKSVGLDDPGMLAMERIVKAIADRES